MSGDPLPLAGPHWAFALALYGQSGVAEACLSLQDRQGVDVSFLIAMLYAAAVGRRRVDAAAVALAEARVAPWRAGVVQPLRTLRRDMKQLSEIDRAEVAALRESVKGVELKSEQIELALLAGAIDGFAPADASAPRLLRVGAMVVSHFAGGPPDADAARSIALISEAAAAVAATETAG